MGSTVAATSTIPSMQYYRPHQSHYAPHSPMTPTASLSPALVTVPSSSPSPSPPPTYPVLHGHYYHYPPSYPSTAPMSSPGDNGGRVPIGNDIGVGVGGHMGVPMSR